MGELRYTKNLPKIEAAVRVLVADLVEKSSGRNNKSLSSIIADWDKNRGNAWFEDIPFDKKPGSTGTI